MEPTRTEYDDAPINSDAHLLDLIIPYRYIITLPTQASPAYGLILLSNRQVTWTVNIPESFVTCIPNALRETILSHTPTVTRAATILARPARDECFVYCLAFQDLTTSHCYRLFRDAAISTLHHHLSPHTSTATKTL